MLLTLEILFWCYQATMRNPQNEKKIYFGENFRQLCAFCLILDVTNWYFRGARTLGTKTSLLFFHQWRTNFLSAVIIGDLVFKFKKNSNKNSSWKHKLLKLKMGKICWKTSRIRDVLESAQPQSWFTPHQFWESAGKSRHYAFILPHLCNRIQ